MQVLRLQPGDALTLFDGCGGQWQASVLHMGRSEVTVSVIAHEAVERELMGRMQGIERAARLRAGESLPAEDQVRLDLLCEALASA